MLRAMPFTDTRTERETERRTHTHTVTERDTHTNRSKEQEGKPASRECALSKPFFSGQRSCRRGKSNENNCVCVCLSISYESLDSALSMSNLLNRFDCVCLRATQSEATQLSKIKLKRGGGTRSMQVQASLVCV